MWILSDLACELSFTPQMFQGHGASNLARGWGMLQLLFCNTEAWSEPSRDDAGSVLQLLSDAEVGAW
jgi:hypothetical protein